MPSKNTLRACSGGSTTAAAIAVAMADGGRRRQQAAGPRTIEPVKPDGVGGGRLAPQQPGDEEAGDDEEDVDADIAAGGARQARVVQDDRQHRDGAQTLDVRTEPGPSAPYPSPLRCAVPFCGAQLGQGRHPGQLAGQLRAPVVHVVPAEGEAARRRLLQLADELAGRRNRSGRNPAVHPQGYRVQRRQARHAVLHSSRRSCRTPRGRSPVNEVYNAGLIAQIPATRDGPSRAPSSSAPYPPIDHPRKPTREVSMPIELSIGSSSSSTIAPESPPSALRCQ